MKRLYSDIEKTARVDSTVYILGESGTGKELVARAIHQLSARKDKKFIDVNCAAIPESLAESELFGHEKGAFSGAVQQRMGKFELAHEGTLFLDEIGELPLDMQAKLLRVLEERRIWRVGGIKSIPVNVRLIVATNRNLEELVQARNFREDLYFRLNVRKIEIPPLREHTEDIPALAQRFLKQFSDSFGRYLPGFSLEALQALKQHRWPGNIRELRNMIERVVGDKHEGELITATDLFPGSSRLTNSNHKPLPMNLPQSQSLNELTAEFEHQVVLNALKDNRWVKFKAAQALGIDRKRLDRIIHRHKIRFPGRKRK